MYKVWFVNFGYYSQYEFQTLQGAVDYARGCSFESVIDAPDGERVASYSAISGLRTYGNALSLRRQIAAVVR